MPRFTIPARYANGIAAIRKLSDEAMREFSSALATVAPSLSTNAVLSAISASVKSLPKSDVEAMVAAVVSLYTALESSDLDVTAFVEELSQAMAESKNKDLHFEGDRDRFKDRLTQLLSIESFNVASKALSLRAEYDHVFCTARIMTDARPVYGSDPSAAPQATLILHTLRLSYHKTDDLEEFYVTFDDSDLEELRSLLNRAELKSKSLAAALNAAGINVIRPEHNQKHNAQS